jgi:hypothetical protein
MQAECKLEVLDAIAGPASSAGRPETPDEAGDSLSPESLDLCLGAAAAEPGLPELVLSRLRELICEAPSGPQLEALVRVAERLPQWHSALRSSADDIEVDSLSLEQAVSEVRRIADLAETSLGSRASQ